MSEFFLRVNSYLQQATEKRGSASKPPQVTGTAPLSVLLDSDSPDMLWYECGDLEDSGAVSQTSTDLVSTQRIQLPTQNVLLDSSPSPLSDTVADSGVGIVTLGC